MHETTFAPNNSLTPSSESAAQHPNDIHSQQYTLSGSIEGMRRARHTIWSLPRASPAHPQAHTSSQQVSRDAVTGAERSPRSTNAHACAFDLYINNPQFSFRRCCQSLASTARVCQSKLAYISRENNAHIITRRMMWSDVDMHNCDWCGWRHCSLWGCNNLFHLLDFILLSLITFSKYYN